VNRDHRLTGLLRSTVILVAAALLAGCGGHKHPPQVKVAFVPRYPTASHERDSSNAAFSSLDWTLPAGTRPSVVYDWYARRLQSLGWRITQRNETGLHAERGAKTLDIGVRDRTLEAIAG
jgi:hypothetical protein